MGAIETFATCFLVAALVIITVCIFLTYLLDRAFSYISPDNDTVVVGPLTLTVLSRADISDPQILHEANNKMRSIIWARMYLILMIVVATVGIGMLIYYNTPADKQVVDQEAYGL